MANDYDYVLIATSIPYDNNYFFDFRDTIGIISFSGWNSLTDLPIENGLVYFIASIVAEEEDMGETHQENTGCLNDFWWDKTGVDVGMRAAFLCRHCRELYRGDPEILADVQRLLDFVSSASRLGQDILTFARSKERSPQGKYDVFLCHNGDDKSVVRKINSKLRLAGIVTWFDEEELMPGQVWQVELEKQIGEVRAACVFVGGKGKGPWQQVEIRAFLSQFVERECKVIPVLLPDAPQAPELPMFLRELMWVDLRTKFQKNFERLVAALKLVRVS
jgi:hypothetical protein